jgi:hypothetical protein
MRTHLLTATAGTALLAIPAQAQNATWLVRAKLRSRLMASTAVLLTTVAMIGTAAPAAAQTTWVGGDPRAATGNAWLFWLERRGQLEPGGCPGRARNRYIQCGDSYVDFDARRG